MFDTTFNGCALADTFDNGGIVVVYVNLLGPSQIGNTDTLQVDAQVFEDGLGASQNGDIFQHGLAPIAIAGGLYSRHVQNATKLIDHQSGQGLAFHVFGNDQQRSIGFGHRLQ